MSMLTPPGMGGKYRITGDKYPRMRRPRNRRRTILAVVASIVALGLAGWGTLQLIDVFTGGGGKKTSATGRGQGCEKTKAKAAPAAPARNAALPKPRTIKVNVYNATKRGGLAKETADELKKRGFTIGKVGNAPPEYDKKVKGAGILLGAPKAVSGVLPVLGTQLKGAVHKADARKDADVDLILGTAFKTLATKKDADKALAALARPAPAPSGKC
ncbi:LytR C-terminal domain-containing protein [Streptomyces sp. ISL-100]|uniref:LytR C-terminal domain-containing protein n=1 Tax=Streptomyces sp. ISL-100 TaxID=2819173 RepID=UPI001BECC965|nr:LytR C-terminal domain-containing protein [Streptomyces sp. ISL-100]MBT2397444.1 LytR C-terminal domain-containing protein [Streptomyces sp. ISL-100]